MRIIARYLIALCCLGSGVDAAERHALLIGVSSYPNLAEQLWLKGPANDTTLMRQVLERRGFPAQNIRVLANGVKPEAQPTRAAIFEELARLARITGKDDFVYLHFSGHGSRQPAAEPEGEPDGLDEIFLPADIGPWEKTTRSVRNAIVDNELGVAVDAIRRGGTFVWAVFDSCHSGTMLRAYRPSAERSRRLAPEALGIPGAADGTRGGLARLPFDNGPPLEVENAGGADFGGLVAFFAAQTQEETPERPLGRVDPKPYGLFTYTLAAILAKNPIVSYRQIGQHILQRYAPIKDAPTPLFVGRLDAAVFGQSGEPPPRQWPIERHLNRLILGAGLLHGIGDGSIVAILPSPTSSNNAVLGYARVRGRDPLEAELLPIDYDGKSALAVERLPKRLFGRLVALAVGLELTVARPPGTDQAQSQRIVRLIDEMKRGSGERAFEIVWVEPDQSADLRLFLQHNQLWLLPPSAELVDEGPSRSLSISLALGDDVLRARLSATLRRIAKARNLMRLSTELPSAIGSDLVEVEVSVRRHNSGRSESLQADRAAQLRHGDIVTFTIANRSKTPVDITALFIDAAYGITAWFPQDETQVNRLESGAVKPLQLEVVTAAAEGQSATLGKEHMLILAVKAERHAGLASYAFLAQPNVLGTRGPLKGTASDLDRLLIDAGFGRPAKRGAAMPRPTALERARLRIISWEALPPDT